MKPERLHDGQGCDPEARAPGSGAAGRLAPADAGRGDEGRGGAARPVWTPRRGWVSTRPGRATTSAPSSSPGSGYRTRRSKQRLHGDRRQGLKELLKSDESTRRISSRLLDLLGPENVHVVALSPPEYEARREAAGNVNRLLARLDAGIIE